MFNLKKYVGLLLMLMMPLISAMDDNNTQEKINKKYEKLIDPKALGDDNYKYFVNKDYIKSKTEDVTKFCFSLRKHILLPDILEDLYKSYEDMEWHNYLIKHDTLHELNSSIRNYDANNVRFQYLLELRYKLHSKRIELFALAKTLQEK